MKMIQVRNVPEPVHRELKARAAMDGLSLSDFILRELERVLQRPSRRELLSRLRSLPTLEIEPSAAEIIRRERDRG